MRHKPAYCHHTPVSATETKIKTVDYQKIHCQASLSFTSRAFCRALHNLVLASHAPLISFPCLCTVNLLITGQIHGKVVPTVFLKFGPIWSNVWLAKKKKTFCSCTEKITRKKKTYRWPLSLWILDVGVCSPPPRPSSSETNQDVLQHSPYPRAPKSISYYYLTFPVSKKKR